MGYWHSVKDDLKGKNRHYGGPRIPIRLALAKHRDVGAPDCLGDGHNWLARARHPVLPPGMNKPQIHTHAVNRSSYHDNSAIPRRRSWVA